MLIEYVKNKQNKRVGVVVALNSKDIGQPNIGWSRCNWRDKFDKKKALSIAIGRAEKRPLLSDNSYMQEDIMCLVPSSMVEAIEKMRVRMKKYFKTGHTIIQPDIQPLPPLFSPTPPSSAIDKEEF